jgi:HAD superfamily hydrolase (TIGR01509 family)
MQNLSQSLSPNLARISGIIFDLDGVLVESSSCHRTAFEQVFQGFGVRDFDYSRYAGRRTPEVIEEVFAGAGRRENPETIAKAAREKSRLALKMFEEQQPLAPGCERILAELAADYKLALASSGSRPSVDAFLRVSGAASLFSSVLSGADVARAKPDPEIYRRSAERLGLDISECLVVEDAEAGVVAARAAGAQVVGIPGTCSDNKLRSAGADQLVSSLRELTEILPRNRRLPVDPSQWTAVIPAAGRGSRLGFNHPKILYPVSGRPILDWLLDFLTPCCSRLIFVLSPEGADEVGAELAQRIPGRYEIVIQEIPTGMGDAVSLGLAQVRTPHLAVVWGDQVALRRQSVEACLRLHQGRLRPDVTCPTVLREKPYIHFDRAADGNISGLRQAREGAEMPGIGESDTGFFCFNAAKLGPWLNQVRASGTAAGNLTREFNLLPVIPWAAREGLALTPRLMEMGETMGVNSPQDAQAVEQFLRRSNGFQV